MPPAPSQNHSKARLHHLEQLHAFVMAATKELMWLNDKEEEEANYDWSERNTNMAAKKDNYSVRTELSVVCCGDGGLMLVPGAGLDEGAGAEREEDEQRPGHRRPAAEGRTPCQENHRGKIMKGPEGMKAARHNDPALSPGLHRRSADPVELDPPAVLLYRNPPETEHRLLSGGSTSRHRTDRRSQSFTKFSSFLLRSSFLM